MTASLVFLRVLQSEKKLPNTETLQIKQKKAHIYVEKLLRLFLISAEFLCFILFSHFVAFSWKQNVDSWGLENEFYRLECEESDDLDELFGFIDMLEAASAKCSLILVKGSEETEPRKAQTAGFSPGRCQSSFSADLLLPNAFCLIRISWLHSFALTFTVFF